MTVMAATGAPSAMAQVRNDYGGIGVDRGAVAVCRPFFDSTYAFVRGPLVTTNATHTQTYALGSGQALGAYGASNYVMLAETSPGYVVKGSCP